MRKCCHPETGQGPICLAPNWKGFEAKELKPFSKTSCTYSLRSKMWPFCIYCTVKRQVKEHLRYPRGLRKENIYQCLLKQKGLWEWRPWICTLTAPPSLLVIGYRAFQLPGCVNCTPEIVLCITFNSHSIANKWKGGNTIRWDDLFLKHKFLFNINVKT